MTDRPVLALLAAPGTARRAVGVLGVAGRSVEVVSWHRRGDARPDAVVATSLAVLDELGADGPEVPWATWVRDEAELAAAAERGAALALTAHPELVAAGAVLVPPVGIEVARWPAAAPLVRRRRRERLDLPERHVVRIPDDEDPAATAGMDAPRWSPLAVCSAAVVHGPATLVALALGAPTVTSAETARRLGLRAGRDVEVATGPSNAVVVADGLASDDARAAVLSRRGRRCAEHHLDLGAPARRLLAELGLAPSAAEGSPAARLEARLDELATPADSRQRLRARDALAGLVADGGGSAP